MVAAAAPDTLSCRVVYQREFKIEGNRELGEKVLGARGTCGSVATRVDPPVAGPSIGP